MPAPFAAAQPAVEQRLPTAALIDLDRSARTALLEAALLAGGQAIWVERTEIDRVLAEQELQAAFGAKGAGERLALGKLLKADVLVLVRAATSSEENAARVVECVVCETKQGLRLQVAAVPAEQPDAAAAAALEAIIQAGLSKSREQIAEIVAVPPLVSDDLGFEHNYLQTAYAKVVEQVLLEAPGLVVVELAEAQAIAQEHGLAGNDAAVNRARLPLYLLGRFRHYGVGDEQTIALRLRLVRGQQELARYEKRDMAPAEAPAWLRDQGAALLKSAKLSAPTQATSAAEAKQLSERAAEFQAIGNGEEALALIEASLLLNSQQETLHHDAVIVCGGLAQKYRAMASFNPEQIVKAVAYYSRGLEHLQLHMRTAGPIEDFRGDSGSDFVRDFASVGWVLTFSLNDVHAEFRPTVKETRERAAQSYLQIARMRAKRGFAEEKWVYYAMLPLEEQEQLAIALQMIEEFQELPDIEHRAMTMAMRGYSRQDSPAFGEFVEKLSQFKSAKIRNIAAALKQQMETKPEPARPLTKVNDGPPVSELTIEPLVLKADQGGVERVVRLPPVNSIPSTSQGDILWPANRVLYCMKKPGRLETLWQYEELNFWFTSVVYDGRNLWVAGRRNRGPYVLLVLDLETGTETRFSPEDGLPTSPANITGNPTLADAIKLVPLEPGRVCLVGNIGRTFIATASCSPDGKKSVRVFHEAREAANTESTAQAENPNVTFESTFALLLQGRDHAQDSPQRRVLVGRHSANTHVMERPLLVDPDGETVTVAPYKLWGETDRWHLAQVQGDVYFYQPTEDGPSLMRIAYPGDKSESVVTNAPEGHLAADGDRLHIVGKKWWIREATSGEITTVANPLPWHYFENYHRPGRDYSQPRTLEGDAIGIRDVLLSQHYGLMVIGFQKSAEHHVFHAPNYFERIPAQE